MKELIKKDIPINDTTLANLWHKVKSGNDKYLSTLDQYCKEYKVMCEQGKYPSAELIGKDEEVHLLCSKCLNKLFPIMAVSLIEGEYVFEENNEDCANDSNCSNCKHEDCTGRQILENKKRMAKRILKTMICTDCYSSHELSVTHRLGSGRCVCKSCYDKYDPELQKEYKIARKAHEPSDSLGMFIAATKSRHEGMSYFDLFDIVYRDQYADYELEDGNIPYTYQEGMIIVAHRMYEEAKQAGILGCHDLEKTLHRSILCMGEYYKVDDTKRNRLEIFIGGIMSDFQHIRIRDDKGNDLITLPKVEFYEKRNKMKIKKIGESNE